MEQPNTLEDTLNDFSKSVTTLLQNPSPENAQSAQSESRTAFAHILFMYQEVGELSLTVYEQFISDSDDCETGFTLINNKGSIIDRYSEQVKERKSFARDLELGNYDKVCEIIRAKYQEMVKSP